MTATERKKEKNPKCLASPCSCRVGKVCRHVVMYVCIRLIVAGGFSLSLSRGMLVYNRIRLARQRDDEEAASTRLDSTRLDSTRAAASRENRPFSSTPVAVVVVVVWFLCDVITYRGIYVCTYMHV